MGEEWIDCKLGELGEFRNGVNFNSSQEGVGLPVIKVKDFGDLTIAPDSGFDELNPQAIRIPADQMVEVGDTLIIRSNGNPALVGRSMLYRGGTKPTTFSGFCIRFRPDRSKIVPAFAAYFIRSPLCRQHFTAYGSGTGIQNLSQGVLTNLDISLPPLPEQRAIARVLGGLDDKIELNRRMNRTLEDLARGVFRSWFVDFDPVLRPAPAHTAARTSTRTHPPHPRFPTRLVDSPLGPIPEGWRVCALREAFEVNPTRRIPAGQTAPYLDMQNMPTASAVPDEWIARACGSGMKFQNGDTLMARITPCLENGKTAYVNFLDDGQVGWGSTEYIVLRSKPPLPPEYSYFLARDEDFRSFAIANMTGSSGRQRVPATAFDKYLVVVPDAAVAAAFGAFARDVLERVRMNSEESRKLAATRDALLPVLLSGEVRLRNEREAERAVGDALQTTSPSPRVGGNGSPRAGMAAGTSKGRA